LAVAHAWGAGAPAGAMPRAAAAPAEPVVATQRTFVATSSVPAAVDAVAKAPTNEIQRLKLERMELAKQLEQLRRQTTEARQKLIQQNAGMAARQKRMDALSAELEQLRQEQMKELKAVEEASGSTRQAESARLVTRLQAINQILSGKASAVESAHP